MEIYIYLLVFLVFMLYEMYKRCIFTACNWFHHKSGIYQCHRCKRISKGAIRDSVGDRLRDYLNNPGVNNE